VVATLERCHDGPLEVRSAADEAQAAAALPREPWDLVVADWSDRKECTLAALAVLAEHRIASPVLALGTRHGEEPAVAALRAGADDYIARGDDERFVAVTRREIAARSCGPALPSAGTRGSLALQRRTAAQCESDLRLRRLFESGVTGVIVCDVRGDILEANETFLNLVGYRREDLVAGRVNWREMTPPEHRGTTSTVIAQARDSGSSVRFEKEYVRQDGTRVPVLLATATLDDHRYLTVVTDLSHRKLAEARMSAMFVTALDAIVGMDDSGRITDFNPAAERIFGYARHQIIGQRMSDKLVPPQLRESHERGFARYLSTGEARMLGRVVELTALRSDGVEIAIELALSRVDAAGDASFFGFVRDVSQRRRDEAALVERALVAGVSARIGLTLTRSDGMRELLASCCDILVQELGVAFARVWLFDRGSQILELQASAGMYTHLDGAHARVPIGQLKIGRIAEQRLRHVTNDVAGDPWIGSPAWAHAEKLVAFAGYPLTVDGELVGVLAMFSRKPLGDITVEMLEAVCDAIAVRARGKLIEQAKSALEEQLRQSQKMEAVGRLAGGIAHDFNNVLSVVLSYTELMLAQTSPGDPLQSDILEINRAGKRAADLTRQLLMFSRQQVTAPVVLDLGALLGQMDKMLRRILGEDVELSYESDDGLGNVRADPGSIEQLIVNLVVNARDAMPRGGRLRVALTNVLSPTSTALRGPRALTGPHVRLSISDSGTGMDEVTLARIYEPFFTTKPVGKGTGLGLATVFGIVQQSGGSIGVQSQPGVGTTFEIFLPRVQGEVAVAVVAEAGSPGARGAETILLVEDEDQVRNVAAGILRRHGYQVLDARNAGDALVLCGAHPGRIDLLLTDVVMPHMSGPELARRLTPIRPDLRVLYMSGYTDEAVIRHGVVEAEVGYLQKPFTVPSLTAKVRVQLDVGARRSAPPS
jgi:PAS domain S-box-containing protein